MIKKSYDVYGKKLKVVFTERIDCDDALGVFIPDEFKVEIVKSIEGDLALATLLHELIHGIIFRCGVHTSSLSDDVQEIICDTIATWIVDNKHDVIELLKN